MLRRLAIGVVVMLKDYSITRLSPFVDAIASEPVLTVDEDSNSFHQSEAHQLCAGEEFL